MRAVVLVGGMGTRLRPLTLSVPKQMLPVGGRPMIEHVVEHLAVHGVDEVVLALGFRPDAFLAAYPDGRCRGVKLRYAVEAEPLDTAGAVAFAAGEAGVDETFVVCNGDVLTDLDLTELVAFHRRSAALATISLTPVEDPSAFGVVPTDGDGRVLAFIEKPRREEAPTNLINGGTYVLEPEVLERIPPGRRVSIERETFPELAATGRLYALASAASWLDAGTPATYLAANLRHAGDAPRPAGVDPAASVADSVLAPDARVGPGARVERSVLMAGARVEAGAVVTDSLLGPGTLVGSGAAVTELSVLGAGAEVAAGRRLRGAHLPES
ncbi:NTP transferase domain-containing protein [Acidimicrobiaceae bacterium USS-CC1]|uniref:NTP transferase domain-containing protein n=1 Tax=Acidiferrimicrobium australe TaxID=2664430 RepID=A0ABW9QTV8_9ACTN|nr:NTP transferase domain-containing protein [Acidiferrimicrobium australe]